MTKLVRLILIFCCLLFLIAIRYFEDVLFYDPYLQFFKSDYLYIDSPRRETVKLAAFTSLRFFLNTILSLAIIYLTFLQKSMIKFATFFYSVAFVIIISVFLYFVIHPRQEDYYLFFNVRRFLIQPLILIILLPAFYYHRIKTRTVN